MCKTYPRLQQFEPTSVEAGKHHAAQVSLMLDGGLRQADVAAALAISVSRVSQLDREHYRRLAMKERVESWLSCDWLRPVDHLDIPKRALNALRNECQNTIADAAKWVWCPRLPTRRVYNCGAHSLRAIREAVGPLPEFLQDSTEGKTLKSLVLTEDTREQVRMSGITDLQQVHDALSLGQVGERKVAMTNECALELFYAFTAYEIREYGSERFSFINWPPSWLPPLNSSNRNRTSLDQVG